MLEIARIGVFGAVIGFTVRFGGKELNKSVVFVAVFSEEILITNILLVVVK